MCAAFVYNFVGLFSLNSVGTAPLLLLQCIVTQALRILDLDGITARLLTTQQTHCAL